MAAKTEMRERFGLEMISAVAVEWLTAVCETALDKFKLHF